jgi:hypothetical protein
MSSRTFRERAEFLRKFKIVLSENWSLGAVAVAGRKAEGIFQNELEGGTGGSWDVQKNNHAKAANIIGGCPGKVNPDLRVENKTFTFRRRRQNNAE